MRLVPGIRAPSGRAYARRAGRGQGASPRGDAELSPRGGAESSPRGAAWWAPALSLLLHGGVLAGILVLTRADLPAPTRAEAVEIIWQQTEDEQVGVAPPSDVASFAPPEQPPPQPAVPPLSPDAAPPPPMAVPPQAPVATAMAPPDAVLPPAPPDAVLPPAEPLPPLPPAIMLAEALPPPPSTPPPETLTQSTPPDPPEATEALPEPPPPTPPPPARSARPVPRPTQAARPPTPQPTPPTEGRQPAVPPEVQVNQASVLGFGRVEGNVSRRAEPLEQRPITYPTDSERRGDQGTVVLVVQVDAAGEVRDVEMVTSSGFRPLDAAAIEAARSWRFRPAERDGQPVASTVRAPVTFRIRDQRPW